MALTALSALALATTMAAAGGQIAQGFAANAAAKDQAGLQEEQARIALDEANVAAEQKSTQRRKFLAEQRMAYLASGVTLEGTPGIVQDDTFKEFQMEIDALRKSGVAQFGLGMKQAAITKNTGRAQLTSGIMSGIGTAATSLATASKSTTSKKDLGLSWSDH